MALFGKPKNEPVSIESEQERLHAQGPPVGEDTAHGRADPTRRVGGCSSRDRSEMLTPAGPLPTTKGRTHE